MRLSLPAVRALLLHQQGLLTPPRKAARKADVLACIRRMKLLQIDTISVVARSPYFVLFSRLGQYEPRWLDELHAAGRLFEYWAHAMCWIPADDWPLFGSVIEDHRRTGFERWKWSRQWLADNPQVAEHVRQRIRKEGGLRSADFENKGVRGPWWDWKGEKAALECLFLTGELMIARRAGFQRVYDLTERVVPDWDPARALPREEIHRRFIRNAAFALGAATEPWLRDYYRMMQVDSRAAIAALLGAGELVQVELDGIKGPAYLHRDLLPVARKAEAGKLLPRHTALLSPFDPVVWDRKRLAALFGFDYTISVYTPGHQREHGYFVLPILHQGRLIGRLDPKAHRKEGVFEVRSLHLEAGAGLGPADWDAVALAVAACADWHNTPQVRAGAGNSAGPLGQLRRALRKHGR
jgi:uncharacterized protein YcaQ